MNGPLIPIVVGFFFGAPIAFVAVLAVLVFCEDRRARREQTMLPEHRHALESSRRAALIACLRAMREWQACPTDLACLELQYAHGQVALFDAMLAEDDEQEAELEADQRRLRERIIAAIPPRTDPMSAVARSQSHIDRYVNAGLN